MSRALIRRDRRFDKALAHWVHFMIRLRTTVKQCPEHSGLFASRATILGHGPKSIPTRAPVQHKQRRRLVKEMGKTQAND